MRLLGIARHGQATHNVWNANNPVEQQVYVGTTDNPLTDTGYHEAWQTGQNFDQYDAEWQSAASSDLIRSIESMRTALEAMHLKDVIPTWHSSHLRERYYGRVQGMTPDMAVDRYPELTGRDLRKNWSIRPPGGESLNDAASRITAYVDEMPQENALLFSHRSAIAGLLRNLLRLSDSHANELDIRTNRPIVLAQAGETQWEIVGGLDLE